ncbi:cobalt transport protein [Leucobacter sp. OLJS4]|uniref:energy-coupling factor transporter transmembrane component T family protein n=1 Tax=unclassified Leucobacter TaxID=2621730 RepID=UPI000C17B31C|nr:MULTISPECIES: energy-coupling factor transporter transmembrane protein EcfT [unclassified Leucobacter]PII82364.1 cobalt transport protein [Leucobacter sp. OLCALW19]PII87456.1 cobalt transport protein [Leucobacter sp. OLTLW20]PII94487.1 cobalt transport protein [Leucobacter sp. OLAS13]PIJ00714.1 cobalt transport protein [Leucobacter sp. OLDS2]PIJ03348.1 cobalt transport protein [Leucobacter sp. OLIS6]
MTRRRGLRAPAGSPIGSYVPGSGPLHRLSPGVKLLALAVFAVGIVATQQALAPTPALVCGLAALALGLLAAVIAGLRGRRLLRVALGFAVVGVLVFAFQAWQHGPIRALTVTSGLFALVIAASAITASTRAEEMVDAITRGLRPFRRFAVDPDRVGLAFSLAFRALPEAFRIAAESRDAARARGLSRNPRAYATPLVIRMVAHARATGAAMQARGLGDD